ncbi:rhomboid family intramembrane serine protease [Flavobacterium album]|uniref:Rhomboid family intramembrane serine protease n=1 Tax=Flavobacterium album TaxID=2175091 RepID=A0A2S1QY96_9FLAO|nr:rhomboid family intramembrane serine protease [Flavobacterium album]AWH85221.1 rhomboid family intramembrane serine protease [Flavobacterium album]
MMNFRLTDGVKHIIIINFIFYICSLLIGPSAYQLLSMHFPSSAEFKFWQPLTYMFMHSQFTAGHIISNMLGVFFFAPALEDQWGTKKFVFFYISCGLGALLLHVGIDYYSFYKGLRILADNGISNSEVISLLKEGKYNPAWQDVMLPRQFHDFMNAYAGTLLGASGAVYGILVAYAFLYPNREMMMFLLPIPIKVKYLVAATLIMDLYAGFIGYPVFGVDDGIAHFAHLGGAAIGYIMMWYWKKNSYNDKRWN